MYKFQGNIGKCFWEVTKEEFYNNTNQKLFESLIESYLSTGSTDILILCKTAIKHEILPRYVTELDTEKIRVSEVSPYVNELFNYPVSE